MKQHEHRLNGNTTIYNIFNAVPAFELKAKSSFHQLLYFVTKTKKVTFVLKLMGLILSVSESFHKLKGFQLFSTLCFGFCEPERSPVSTQP